LRERISSAARDISATVGAVGTYRGSPAARSAPAAFTVWGLGSVGLRFVVQTRPPRMRFLFIRSGLCLRLPSDSTSRWTPLPLASGSHYQAHSGLSPPSYRPVE
jgi:hypothetical protein